MTSIKSQIAELQKISDDDSTRSHINRFTIIKNMCREMNSIEIVGPIIDEARKNYEELRDFNYGNFNESAMCYRYDKLLNRMQEFLDIENPSIEESENFYANGRICLEIREMYIKKEGE